MKISFIAENDWANVLTEYSYCLNKHSKNIEAKSICLNKHSFNYTIQHDYDLSDCTYDQKLEAQKFIFESDVIIFGEEGTMQPTNYRVLEIYKQILGLDLLNSDKKLLIWHPGTCYRQNFSFYNNHPLRNRLHKHLYAMDLYRLSPKTQNDTPLWPYQYYNFQKDKFILDFKLKLKNKPWTILHIPSNINTKGTSEITNNIKNLNLNKTNFNYKVLTNISYKKVLEEKKKSIFYIDQYKPSIGGYGIASLEGLFTSNLTFATVNNIGLPIQKLTNNNEIGIIPLGENVNDLANILNHFLNELTSNEWIDHMEDIGDWVEKYYSPNSIINFFKKIIE